MLRETTIEKNQFSNDKHWSVVNSYLIIKRFKGHHWNLTFSSLQVTITLTVSLKSTFRALSCGNFSACKIATKNARIVLNIRNKLLYNKNVIYKKKRSTNICSLIQQKCNIWEKKTYKYLVADHAKILLTRNVNKIVCTY